MIDYLKNSISLFFILCAFSSAADALPKEVHTVLELTINSTEISLTFKIETGQNFKLFLNDEEDLDGFQNGQEFEILYEESIYEKNPLILLGIDNYSGPLYENLPLLLLGIKNLETNKEYLVKADAFYRWKPKAEDGYRVMTLTQNCYPGDLWDESPRCSYALKDNSGQMHSFFANYNFSDYLENSEAKVMILESINGKYKVINLKNGKLFLGRIMKFGPTGFLEDISLTAWP